MTRETKKKSPKIQKGELPSGLDSLLEDAERADLEIAAAEAERFKNNPPKFGVVTDEPEQDIGKRVQQSREDKGLTQGQLSELTVRADKDNKGISRAVISMYEAGKNRPGPKEIRLLCECLRVTPSYLIYGDDDPFEQMTEYGRFWGVARSEAEYSAYLLYIFSRLHGHHKQAMLKIMQDLVRPWEKGFDAKMRKDAFPKFIDLAKQLEEELRARGE